MCIMSSPEWRTSASNWSEEEDDEDEEMEDFLEGSDFTETLSDREAEDEDDEEEEEDLLDGMDLTSISSLMMIELRLGWDLWVLMVL